MTDIASMEEDLANLRGQVILGLNPILGFGLFDDLLSQVGEGGSPLGDYVSFDKFRAGRSEGPSELG